MKNDELNYLLRKNDKIAIYTHIRPDGDALGSALAWGRALKKRGKEIKLFCPDVIPAKYSFLPDVQSFQKELDEAKAGELSFILDCSDLDRLDYFKEKALQSRIIVNIDHHRTNNGFGKINIIDTSAAATAEIIYRLISENGWQLDREISLSLYVAIVSDTGSFKFDNTTPQTLSIASKLLSYGINPSMVSQKIFDERPLSSILLLRDTLNTLKLDNSKKIAWVTVTEEMLEKNGAKPEELDGFVNYVRDIEGVEVGVIFYHTRKGETKVGFRSKGVDVSSIAFSLGGGGHPRAAGCTITGPPEQVVNKVLATVKESIDNDKK